MIKEFDVVELIRDIPRGRLEGLSLKAGTRGAVVERYSNDVFLVEFVDEDGETLDVTDVTRADIRVLKAEETSRS